MSIEQWNKLSKLFDTSSSQVDRRAADNVLIAWPVFINFLQTHLGNSRETKILDYGCGAGGFCHELYRLGYDVTGVDISPDMIGAAQASSPSGIDYMIGDASVLTEKYDTITSVMSLQFIEDIDTCIEKLCTHCRQYILFAVFNPKWVEECLSSKKGSFPDRENWVSQGVSLPVFHRSKKEYDNMFQANGFLNVFEEYPSFTSEFVEQYSWDRPSNVSEFMILGYQKEMH